MKDNRSNQKFISAINIASATGTVNGESIDLQGFDAKTLVINVQKGTYSGSNYITFKIQESDDGSTGWTDVSSDDLNGAFPLVKTALTKDALTPVSYLGTKRYVRVVATVSGTLTGVNASAFAVLGSPDLAPVNN